MPDKIAKLRKEILEGMCYCAERTYRLAGHGAIGLGKLPAPFKPGVADRLLFKFIIDTYYLISPAIEDPEIDKYDLKVVGMNALTFFYFPMFVYPGGIQNAT